MAGCWSTTVRSVASCAFGMVMPRSARARDQLRGRIDIDARQDGRELRVEGGERRRGLVPERRPGGDVDRDPGRFHPDDGRQGGELQRGDVGETVCPRGPSSRASRSGRRIAASRAA